MVLHVTPKTHCITFDPAYCMICLRCLLHVVLLVLTAVNIVSGYHWWIPREVLDVFFLFFNVDVKVVYVISMRISCV